MMPDEKSSKVSRALNDTGMYVYINILYPAIKKHGMDIDYLDVCRLFPEYKERVLSDKSKRTRLSKAKTILKNGWERDALQLISLSDRLDDKSKKTAVEYLNLHR